MDSDGNEFQADVKEGELLIFPSGYLHKSPPKLSDDIKTIIAFNFSVASKYSQETLKTVKETHPSNFFEDVRIAKVFEV